MYLNIAIAIVQMDDAHAWYGMTRERERTLCLRGGREEVPKGKGVIPNKMKENGTTLQKTRTTSI